MIRVEEIISLQYIIHVYTGIYIIYIYVYYSMAENVGLIWQDVA